MNFTLEEAVTYASQGKAHDWIQAYLREEGDNIPFADGLLLEKRFYTHPLKIDLNKFNRICGPEENMKFRVSKDIFEQKVSNIIERRQKGWDMPPLIINYDKGVFDLNDGNHRHEAMLRSGVNEYYAVFWATGRQDYNELKKKLKLSC